MEEAMQPNRMNTIKTAKLVKTFFQSLSEVFNIILVKTLFKNRLNRLMMTIATVIFLCSITTLIIVHAKGRKISTTSENIETSFVAKKLSNNSPKITNIPPAQSTGKEEGEMITIRPAGFDPKVITRPKGRFTLLVDNRSGLEEIQLRFDRIAGNRLHDVLVPRQKLDWVQGLDLQPGNYILTEANHPDWTCAITITEK
jgi:hypothetical protein